MAIEVVHVKRRGMSNKRVINLTKAAPPVKSEPEAKPEPKPRRLVIETAPDGPPIVPDLRSIGIPSIAPCWRNALSRRGLNPRVSRGPASRRRRERDRDPCLAKSIRHHTGAAGSDASDSIRACCLSSAQNSEGILPCSEL